MLKQFFTKKINKQEEQPAMTKVEELLARFGELSDEEKEQVRKGTAKDTTEQIDEAKKNIEEKGADKQTEKDCIDESVAMQEKNEGDKDSQTAKDRVDEAEGEDRYLAHENAIKELRAEIAEMKKAHADAVSKPKVVDDKEAKSLDEIRNRYLN